MKAKSLPPRSFLLECFTYNPDSGMLIWNVRPESHFKTPSAHKHFNTKLAGKAPRNISSNGYASVNFSGGEFKGQFRQHRIIWMMHYGADPGELIDHIDQNKLNNRICNLRPFSKAENNHNGKLYRRNKSGFRGVTTSRWGNRFTAQITVDGRKAHLGTFDTAEEAHKAYQVAANKQYPTNLI